MISNDGEAESSINREEVEEITEISYKDKIRNASVIAKPMASKKLAKKCYKLIKKAAAKTLASVEEIKKKKEEIDRKQYQDRYEEALEYEVPKANHYIRCGLKDVQKRIRHGEIGIVVFAGDVSPEDIMCHMPALCEEKDIPYVYTPSRKDLGAAVGIKRGCLMVLIKSDNSYETEFNELKDEIKYLDVPL